MVEPIDSAWRVADSAVVLGVLGIALLAGLRARKPADAREYFFGGRRLAWPIVGISLAASEIGFTFALVAVPWTVYQPRGGFGCLQALVLGGLLARFAVAAWMLPRFFEREIESPFDLIGARLGETPRRLATALFALGATAAQAARLYLSALVLVLVLDAPLAGLSRNTGVPIDALIVLALAAVAWITCARRGIAALVIGDLPLFAVMLVAVVVALGSLSAGLEGGFDLIRQVGIDSHKSDFWSFERSPALGLSFWTAAIAGSWGGTAAYGADPLVVQRLLACGTIRNARRALFLGLSSVVVLVLASYVGVALFAWYERMPLPAPADVLAVGHGERIYAYFLEDIVPGGSKGWVVAGIAAAAISSSRALMLTLGHAAGSFFRPASDASRELQPARVHVFLVGLLLTAAAIGLGRIAPRIGALLALAYDMELYLRGALLAGLWLAFLRRPVGSAGYAWSAPIAVVFVFGLGWHGPRSNLVCLTFAGGVLLAWIALRMVDDVRRGVPRAPIALRTAALVVTLLLLVWANRYGLVLIETDPDHRGKYGWLPLASGWYVPIGSTIAFVLGCLLGRGGARSSVEHATNVRPSTA